VYYLLKHLLTPTLITITSSISSCRSAIGPVADQLPIDLESDTAVLHLNLRDVLFEELEFEDIGDYSVAYVDAQMQVRKQADAAAAASAAGGAAKAVALTAEEMKPALQPLAAGVKPQGHSAVMLSMGDIKLSKMKAVLNKQGLSAEFHMGQLRCSGHITLRKERDESNHIVIDGPLCDEYYRIRDLLYSQFVIL
jgi:cleavage and polyadenylation specificity factor subunit 2